MTPNDVRVPRTRLTARRLALLASVAGIGAAVLLTGPGFGSLNLAGMTPSAHAAGAVQQPTGFADLVAKVKPAVISVRVKIDRTAETTGSGGGNVLPFGQGAPLDKFFQQFGFSDAPNGMRQPRQMITGEGSGFFISSDGYAVTNNHVVDHASSVEVKTDDGKTYTAKVIGTDPKTDVALIKVDGAAQRQGAAGRRLGRGGRQSVRPRRHRDGRHRVGARARHRRRRL
jgi:serine protease Do